MATSFFIRTKKTSGLASVRARIQIPEQKIDWRITTGLHADIKRWNAAKKSALSMKNYRESEDGTILWKKLDTIAARIDAAAKMNLLTAEYMKEIIETSVLEEQINQEQERQEKANKVTLLKYIDIYMEQCKSGGRSTYRGGNFSPNTIKALNVAINKLKDFFETANREYDFEEVDMNFYREFNAYLKGINYSINSIGKVMKTLKTLFKCAEEDGHPVHPAYKTSAFKATRIDVDSIYLTKDELEAINKVDLSNMSAGYELARDIFMIGVWTAQRVSDYNNISRDNIHNEIFRSYGEDGKVTERKVMTIHITQQKVNKKVIIPCCSELRDILAKYPETLPHIAEQKINDYMKEIGRKAGLTELIEITSTKGGNITKTKIEKCELIQTHTARRTGATLMYLSGMNVYDICKITGHSNIKTLEKYIKADSLETVKKMTEDYDYFK